MARARKELCDQDQKSQEEKDVALTLDELAKQQQMEEGELQIDYEEFLKFKEITKNRESIQDNEREKTAEVALRPGRNLFNKTTKSNWRPMTKG